MRLFFALIAGVCGLGICTWVAFADTPTVSVLVLPQAAGYTDASEMFPHISGALEFQGSLSCTAASCHNYERPDPRPGAVRRDEYSIWSERDPHAQAYDVLVEDWAQDESKSIAKKLGITSMSDPQFQNCLACHSPNRSLSVMTDHSQPSSSPYLSTREGVGCEACHGPSQNWRTKHYLSDWDAESAADHGMLSTKGNLLRRARLCAECHVGSQNREVNHDMIAAGHPMLRFEMTVYSDLMPKHWKTDAGETQQEVWAAGQIAAADAALQLLEARAAKSSPQAIWPEFSEYACFHCHHDMNAGDWQPERKYATVSAAAPKWGDWYFSMLTTAAEADNTGSKPLAEALKALKATMDEYFPDPGTVQKNVQTVRQELYKWAGEHGTLHATDLVKAVSSKEEDGPVASWDTATQVYLALAAIDSDQPGLGLRPNLKALLENVRFPANYRSPQLFAGPKVGKGTPPNRRQFLDALTGINNTLNNK